MRANALTILSDQVMDVRSTHDRGSKVRAKDRSWLPYRSKMGKPHAMSRKAKVIITFAAFSIWIAPRVVSNMERNDTIQVSLSIIKESSLCITPTTETWNSYG